MAEQTLSQPISFRTPPEPALPGRVDLRLLDAMSDEELDLLPYGVIAVDRRGVVQRYNLAEARLARLDPRSVIGRHFFEEVAPCTSNPEFEGRFAELVESPGDEVRYFPYVFDFKFGAQEVEVEMCQGMGRERFYFVINRRAFYPPRTEVPAETLAPLQEELEPAEASRGVRRDAQARRTIQVSPSFLASMSATWKRVAPRGWPVFCQAWGHDFGQRTAVEIESEVLLSREKTLRELPMREVIERLATYLEAGGWGQIGVDFAHARDGILLVTLERNALAESVGYSSTPCCSLFEGFFRAFLSQIAAKVLVVKEGVCKSQGYPRCTFLVVGKSRRQALEDALAAGGDVADMVAAVAAWTPSGYEEASRDDDQPEE